MTPTVRITITNERNSGGRVGWSKLVTSVDATKTDGYAFVGRFLNDGTETDVPIGSVIVQSHPEGSVKRAHNSGHCYVVGSDGVLYTTGVEAKDWRKNFLSFRDGVTRILLDPDANLPEAAGGPPETAPPATVPVPDRDAFLKAAPPLMLPLDGWTMFVETSGGWVWSHDGANLSAYASPFWDDCDGIPLDFCAEFGDSLVSCVIPFALCGDLADDIARYRDAIRPYLRLRPGMKGLSVSGTDRPGGAA